MLHTLSSPYISVFLKNTFTQSRVAGTMVVHSSSVRVIACFDPKPTPTSADACMEATGSHVLDHYI